MFYAIIKVSINVYLYLCTFPGTCALVTSVVDNEWLNMYPVEWSLRGFPP